MVPSGGRVMDNTPLANWPMAADKPSNLGFYCSHSRLFCFIQDEVAIVAMHLPMAEAKRRRCDDGAASG